jgi:threonylcarbamoyladenosine tRNA methylthiotransferase MtaB
MNRGQKKKYFIGTLGCKTNQYESQALQEQLFHLDYEEVKEGEIADLVIINTCSVTSQADSHSRRMIRQLIEKHPGAKVAVTGCSAIHKNKTLLQIPGVSEIIPEKEKLVSKLHEESIDHPFSISRFSGYTRAFLKIQDGCNSFCSYCIIPYLRGRSRSRSVGEIVEEAERVLASGHKEIVLTGINIGDFDGQGEKTLAYLIRKLEDVHDLRRLRISSINPNDFDDELIDVITSSKKVLPSLHLSVQSGSNRVLEKMRRKYTREEVITLTEKIRTKKSPFTFTSDFIVGFPEETEEDFQNTLSMIENIQFLKAHLFPYSERENTDATKIKGKVPSSVITRRQKEALAFASRVSEKVYDQFLDTEALVLTEGEERGLFGGLSEHGLSTYFSEEGLLPNSLIHAKLVKNTEQGMLGKVLQIIE